jgi:uncharacterized membrane protein
MKEIPIGAEVTCTDGSAGHSTCLIVNPNTLQVTHYVVKEKKSPHEERLIPIDLVTKVKSKQITLSCTIADLSEMEVFSHKETIQVEIPTYIGEATWVEKSSQIRTMNVVKQNVPPGELAVCKNAKVEAADGVVGQVDELLTDSDSGEITHFVLKENHPWGAKEVVLPVSLVEEVGTSTNDDVESTVYLSVKQETVASMLAIPEKWRQQHPELITLTSSKLGTASEALKAVQKLTKTEDVGILNAAVLIKDEDGKASLQETEDVGSKHGTLFGAITGGLIGLIGGPVGVVAGAVAGAATGRIAANWIDMGFSDDYLKSLQEEVQPGTSLLVVLVEGEWVQKVIDTLAGFEGHVGRQHLNPDEVTKEK